MAKAEATTALTVNELLLDRATTHSMYLQHAGNGTARRVRTLMFQAQEDILERLQGRLERAARLGFDPGPVTTKRLRDLSTAYRKLTADLMPTTRALIASDMIDVSLDEVRFQQSMIADTLPVTFDTTIPSTQQLRTFALRAPFEGKVLSEWTQQLGRSTLARFNQQVKLGLVNGEGIEAIARRLRGTRARGFRDGALGWQRHEAQTLARTAVAHAQGEADDLFFQANSELLKGVQWSATLDTKTCQACANLDGRFYRLSQPRPPKPLHWNCRCDYIPVTKSFRELGFNVSEIPQGKRASMTGDVPGSLTYADWLKRQKRSIQREALGPARLEMYKKGQPISTFANRQNRVLTLDEVRKREGR